MKKASALFWGAIFLFTACGYHFSGSGARIPEGVRTVSIPVFTNQTIQTGIESQITRALVDRFTSAKQLAVTDQNAADAILSGVVKSFLVSPTTVTLETQVATEYRATLTIEVTFRRQRDDKVLWRGEIREWRNYPVVSDLLVTEANKQEAIRQASELLAEKLYQRLLEDF